MLNSLGLPVQASTHTADIDQMIALVHWLMLVLFIAVSRVGLSRAQGDEAPSVGAGLRRVWLGKPIASHL
jgi:hypothetical protein